MTQTLKEHKTGLCLQPCPYLFPVKLSIHINNLYKTAASFFSVTPFCHDIQLASWEQQSSPSHTHFAIVKLNIFFFCVIQNKCTHILIFSSVFFISLFSKKIKKKNCCYLHISKQEKETFSTPGLFFSFFFPLIGWTQLTCVLSLFFFTLFFSSNVYLHVALVSDVLWQTLCLKWPKRRGDDLCVHSDCFVPIWPFQVLWITPVKVQLLSARREGHLQSFSFEFFPLFSKLILLMRYYTVIRNKKRCSALCLELLTFSWTEAMDWEEKKAEPEPGWGCGHLLGWGIIRSESSLIPRNPTRSQVTWKIQSLKEKMRFLRDSTMIGHRASLADVSFSFRRTWANSDGHTGGTYKPQGATVRLAKEPAVREI